MIKRLAHVCFFSDKVEAMVHFYNEIIGLPLHFSFKNESGKVFGYYFKLGADTFLEIFDQKSAIERWGGKVDKLAQSNGSPYRHFCIEVEGLEAYRGQLIAKGISVTEIVLGEDFSKQAWIQDPDGNAIELMEYTKDSLQRK